MKSSKNLGQVANKMFRALEHLPDAKENAPGSGKQQAPSAGIAKAAGPQLLQRPTVSIIAEDLLIEGKIRAKGDIELRGELQGDLNTDGNILVSGKVAGDLQGRGVQILRGEVKGNITAHEGVTVDQGSLVIGDISAESIQAAGRLKGNLKVKGKTVLADGAFLLGNVETCFLSLEEGAIITGSIQMEDGKADELFSKDGARKKPEAKNAQDGRQPAVQ